MNSIATTHDELVAELLKLDEQLLAMAAAMLFALNHDPGAHGWLSHDLVLKLGPVARYAIMDQNREQTEQAAEVEKNVGWMLDIFMPNREKPSDN